ncbi:MAG: hypothetical protein G01um101438_942 [Parcubacteria group bacterium Gr01-1014_38]|nr:MAG: hypothetical protein G01um101438_942 [Parcubacteria group bacterium Gr01-1014_38]
MRVLKVIGFGILNFVGRFLVGGILFAGLKINPETFVFGATLTVTAFLLAYGLLRFVMRPPTRAAAVKIAFVWILIAALFDAMTAGPIVNVSAAYLFSEVQTWTRLLAILVAALLLPKPRQGMSAP